MSVIHLFLQNNFAEALVVPLFSTNYKKRFHATEMFSFKNMEITHANSLLKMGKSSKVSLVNFLVI